jgi:hypothetical protein
MILSAKVNDRVMWVQQTMALPNPVHGVVVAVVPPGELPPAHMEMELRADILNHRYSPYRSTWARTWR